MTTGTRPHHGGPAVVTRAVEAIEHVRSKLRRRAAHRAAFVEARRELGSYSPRDLAELGYMPSDIHQLARATADARVPAH